MASAIVVANLSAYRVQRSDRILATSTMLISSGERPKPVFPRATWSDRSRRRLASAMIGAMT